jgi:glutaredoxin-like protein
MQLLKEKDRKAIQESLKDLPSPVTIVFFTQEFECEFCGQAHQLLDELTGLSEQLTLEVHDFSLERDLVERYGIDKIPAIALVRGTEDSGIRFYGVPAGYEFATLLEGIKAVASADSGLSDETKAALAGIKQKVHLQVYVTPT